MAITKEIWTDYIEQNLYTNNDFLNFAFNSDQFVVEGKTVHHPTAGTAAGVKRNRATLPAIVEQRTDTDQSYDLDEFTTDPVLIPKAEEYELAYDKIDSILFDEVGQLAESVGDWILYAWRMTTSTYQVRTTGDSVTAHAPSATGNRKSITGADVQNAAKALSKAKVPKNDRYLLLDADMYQQLLSDLKYGEFRDTVKEADLAQGIIGKLFGFNIMERATVLNCTTGLTYREPGATGATTDHAVALAWHKNSVEKAVGTIDFFEDIGNPLYYGNVYSALVRSGGMKRRSDGIGVVAIIQSAV